MNSTPSTGGVRPVVTPSSGTPPPLPGPPGSALPLLSLRGERRVIDPDECRLGEDCVVCAWRRQGLLDPPPGTEAA